MSCIGSLKARINYSQYEKQMGQLTVTVNYTFKTYNKESDRTNTVSTTKTFYMLDKSFTGATASVGGGLACAGTKSEWESRVKFTETHGQTACGAFSTANKYNLAVQSDLEIISVIVNDWHYSLSGESCDLQPEESFLIEKKILDEITAITNNNCLEIQKNGTTIQTICSDPDCNPPKYKIECDPVECPDGTCCECRSGDYICCYNNNGTVIKKFRYK